MCKDCANFYQHYGLSDKKLFALNCGHCTHRKPRHKSPLSAVCDQFSPAAKTKELFASKEYLSKALLKYILELELLPEIISQLDDKPKAQDDK